MRWARGWRRRLKIERYCASHLARVRSTESVQDGGSLCHVLRPDASTELRPRENARVVRIRQNTVRFPAPGPRASPIGRWEPALRLLSDRLTRSRNAQVGSDNPFACAFRLRVKRRKPNELSRIGEHFREQIEGQADDV
jgi:hypothetical protein